MKRTFAISAICYVVYGLFVWLYLFHLAPVGIPDAYIGTAADPATFMDADQLATSIQFSRTRQLMFFLSTPFEWLAMLFFIFGGPSKGVEEVVKSKWQTKWLQVTIYYFAFALFTFSAMLPFRFISYQLARFYGTSTMTLTHWIRNRGIDFMVDFLLMVVIVHMVLFLARMFKKRWWFVTWLAFIPFAFFFMLIEPIVVDPLYNDFQPIQDPVLEARILTMATDAGVRADRVFEMEVSSRTHVINGYVTGVGPTARIVLWDTALQQLNEDEILFLMAHEIAHYVYRDIYRGIGVAIAFTFAGLYIVYKMVDKMNKESLKRIPVAMLVASIFLFAVSPATNAISRRIEVRADEFALELTGDPEAGIGLFQAFAQASLNEVNTPRLVRIFRSTHPTTFERISRMMEE